MFEKSFFEIVVFWLNFCIVYAVLCACFFGTYYDSPVFLADPTETYTVGTFITVGTNSEMFSQNDYKKVYG